MKWLKTRLAEKSTQTALIGLFAMSIIKLGIDPVIAKPLAVVAVALIRKSATTYTDTDNDNED